MNYEKLKKYRNKAAALRQECLRLQHTMEEDRSDMENHRFNSIVLDIAAAARYLDTAVHKTNDLMMKP